MLHPLQGLEGLKDGLDLVGAFLGFTAEVSGELIRGRVLGKEVAYDVILVGETIGQEGNVEFSIYFQWDALDLIAVRVGWLSVAAVRFCQREIKVSMCSISRNAT
ncbi:MAG: hypothetical protein ACOVRB_04975 [Akkermansiaceae bacterium]